MKNKDTYYLLNPGKHTVEEPTVPLEKGAEVDRDKLEEEFRARVDKKLSE